MFIIRIIFINKQEVVGHLLNYSTILCTHTDNLWTFFLNSNVEFCMGSLRNHHHVRFFKILKIISDSFNCGIGYWMNINIHLGEYALDEVYLKNKLFLL